MAAAHPARIAVTLGTLVLVLTAGACGDSGGIVREPSTQATGSAPDATGGEEETASSTSTATTVATTTTSAVETTAAEPAPTLREDGTPLALPALSAEQSRRFLPAATIPWEAVTNEWLLVEVVRPPGSAALVLLDPEDRVYGLGGWDPTWRPLDWNGRRILYLKDARLTALDVATGAELGTVTIVEGEHAWVDAWFGGAAGDSIVVNRRSESTVRIDFHSLATGARATLFEWPIPEDANHGEPPWRAAWLRHPDGNLVVVSGGGSIAVASPAGEPQAELPSPGVNCWPVRWWAPSSVLVSCTDPVYAQSETAQCWPGTGRRLWALPIDGGEPTAVTPPIGPGGEGCEGYEAAHNDALAVNGVVAMETGGCCDCGGDLFLIEPDGSMLGPADDEALMALECSPDLITIRNGAFVVAAIDTTPDGMQSALYELIPGGEYRPLLPGLVPGAVLTIDGPARRW